MQTIISSQNPGPTLTIIGGTHGNETCGVELIDYLKDNLTLKKGKVILTYGNLQAIRLWVRQIGMNLNRAFLPDELLTESRKNTYEYARSRELMELFKISDYTLDIHSSPSLGSPPMIICEKNAEIIAAYFPFSIRCTRFDTIEPGSTEYYMNSLGKIWLGIECGNHNDPEAFDRALESTITFLSYLDMIDWEKKIYDQTIYRASGKYLTETTDFRVSKNFSDFEFVQKWQPLGTDGDTPIFASTDGYILFARDRKEVGVEAFVLMTRE